MDVHGRLWRGCAWRAREDPALSSRAPWDARGRGSETGLWKREESGRGEERKRFEGNRGEKCGEASTPASTRPTMGQVSSKGFPAAGEPSGDATVRKRRRHALSRALPPCGSRSRGQTRGTRRTAERSPCPSAQHRGKKRTAVNERGARSGERGGVGGGERGQGGGGRHDDPSRSPSFPRLATPSPVAP